MATLDDVDADTAWQLAPHICRNCCHRVLVRARADGRTIARCSGCELEKIGGAEALCWCGSLLANFKIGLRCVRNQHVTAESPDAIVVVEADGNATAGPVAVNYFEVEGVPKKFFRCAGYRATLSVDACAANWRRAQQLTAIDPGFTGLCRQCPIGARHAGEAFIERSKLFGVQICPRTRKWAARFINDRLGVSAYNREREFRIQRSCKNRPPRFRFDPRRLGVIVGYGTPEQRYIEVMDELTRDVLELVIQTLRTIPGRIAFTRPRGVASMTTAEMAAELAPARRKTGLGYSVMPRKRPRKLKTIDLRSNEQRDEPQENEQREALAAICVTGATA